MPRFHRSSPGRLDSEVRRSLQRSIGRPPRVLAWAPSIEGFAVGQPEQLSVLSGDGWRHIPWHHIDHGEWNPETSTLSWSGPNRLRGLVVLPDPGRLPELLRERVAASIAVEEHVDIPGTRQGATLMARRPLDGGPLEWRIAAGRGTDLRDPAVKAVVDEILRAREAEYSL